MMFQPERRTTMVPPSRDVPPAVVQVVIEVRDLLKEIREHYHLDRRGKEHPRGEPVR